eukprot:1161963-Pelagomonas_calceolata.AAC.3
MDGRLLWQCPWQPSSRPCHVFHYFVTSARGVNGDTAVIARLRRASMVGGHGKVSIVNFINELVEMYALVDGTLLCFGHACSWPASLPALHRVSSNTCHSTAETGKQGHEGPHQLFCRSLGRATAAPRCETVQASSS